MLNTRSIYILCLGLPLLLLTPILSSAQVEDVECSEQYLMSYFPEPFVENTLENFNVAQEKRSGIIEDLKNENTDIVSKVEEKASKMNPNPLRDPNHRHEAVQIFRETLYETFSSVMKDHGIVDDNQVREMLESIQEQKAKHFAMCIEKQRGFRNSPPPSMNQESPMEPSSEGFPEEESLY